MKIISEPLPGIFLLEPTIFEDSRGLFFEKFNAEKFKELTASPYDFVQDNVSVSRKNVVRGLHFQTGNMAQGKLVSCVRGAVWDVAVDLRQNSPTFKKHFGVKLSEENRLQFFIPRGFAHGFAVLSEEAEFHYKCDNYFSKEHDGGIYYKIPELNIDWQLEEKNIILSEKDQNLPNIDSITYF